jgi:hypothetical protein
MTAVSSRSHASCRVWARTHQSHKATRHAARGRQDQFLTMRYNTGLTAAPASPLYGSPVCKLNVKLNVELNVELNVKLNVA